MVGSSSRPTFCAYRHIHPKVIWTVPSSPVALVRTFLRGRSSRSASSWSYPLGRAPHGRMLPHARPRKSTSMPRVHGFRSKWTRLNRSRTLRDIGDLEPGATEDGSQMTGGGNVVLKTTHHVRPELIKDFLATSKGLLAAASQAKGYLNSFVTPPTADHTEWCITVQFNSNRLARRWLGSASHNQWMDMVNRLAPQTSTYLEGAQHPAGSTKNGRRSSTAGPVSRWKLFAVNMLSSFSVVLVADSLVNNRPPASSTAAQMFLLCAFASTVVTWFATSVVPRLIDFTARTDGQPREVGAIPHRVHQPYYRITADLVCLPTIPDGYRPKSTPGRHSPEIQGLHQSINANRHRRPTPHRRSR